MGFMGLGDLPKEYNRKIHGPYDPAVFYGKKDTPLGETKLSELPKWLTRRNYSPITMGRSVSRFYWRWQHKYVQPRFAGLTPLIQLAVATIGGSITLRLVSSLTGLDSVISVHKNNNMLSSYLVKSKPFKQIIAKEVVS